MPLPTSHKDVHDRTRVSLARALAELRSEASGPLSRPSRELSLAITKVEEAIHWHEAIPA